MKSEADRNDTSVVEVLNVSQHGFWLWVGAEECFLDFDNFPWFRKASLDQLFDVELSNADHLYWKELDVDLDLDRIKHPEKFPLVARG